LRLSSKNGLSASPFSKFGVLYDALLFLMLFLDYFITPNLNLVYDCALSLTFLEQGVAEATLDFCLNSTFTLGVALFGVKKLYIFHTKVSLLSLFSSARYYM